MTVGIKAPDDTLSGPDLQLAMAEYRAVFTIAAAIDMARLAKAIRTFEYALTLGPFVDPTAYMNGAGNTRSIVEALGALQEFRRQIEPARLAALR